MTVKADVEDGCPFVPFGVVVDKDSYMSSISDRVRGESASHVEDPRGDLRMCLPIVKSAVDVSIW